MRYVSINALRVVFSINRKYLLANDR